MMGIAFYSTIDKNLYDKMNEVGKNFEHYGFTYTREVKDPHSGEIELKEDPVQVGAIMIENSTGKILSFIGGRDHNQEAIESCNTGISSKWIFDETPTRLCTSHRVRRHWGRQSCCRCEIRDVQQPDGSTWSPSNYNATAELGIVPAREALAKSLNLATARLYRDIIDRRPAEFLEKMGISRLTPRRLC